MRNHRDRQIMKNGGNIGKKGLSIMPDLTSGQKSYHYHI